MVSTPLTAQAQILTLENSALRLLLRPDLGGRIDQLTDLRTGQDWLWHPPGYDPTQTRSLPLGASFDDQWSGGWDEMFPNDAAGNFRGYDLVDHGEFWSQPWQVVEHSSHSVSLTYQCQRVPVAVEKTIHLNADQTAMIQYRFQNQSDDTIPFLFKQHAALAIAPGDEILLPDCLVEAAFLEFSKLIGQAGKFPFPQAVAADGSNVDLRYVPDRSSGLQEFYYCSELARGECGIRRQDGSSLRFQFDRADFPYVWVFQSYGGWKDHYMLVMEPATTMPFDLEIASQQGTIAHLPPRATQTRQLTVALEAPTR